MEGLVVILVIFFVVTQIAKSAKKTASNSQGAKGQTAAQPPQPKPAKTDVWAQIGEMFAEQQATGDEEGVSSTDEEGCVGGSMAHSGSHEGMSDRAAFEGTALAADRVEPQNRPAPSFVPTQTVKKRVTIPAMRDAVVMAEVLSAPLALRPHGRFDQEAS